MEYCKIFFYLSVISAPTERSLSTIPSYPLKIRSALSIIVVPSASNPATTSPAPALKSVAETGAPDNFSTPSKYAVLCLIRL